MSGHVGSDAQREASRKNGALGGRPRKEVGTGEIRRLKDEARRTGERAAAKVPEILERWMTDTRVSIGDRLQVMRELCDRFGFPRQQVTAMMSLGEDAPKLFDLTPFEPPASHGPASENGDDLKQPNVSDNGSDSVH